jgi:hypothetical protein
MALAASDLFFENGKVIISSSTDPKDGMVKLLRAHQWMPWHKKAKKDVVSCDKPRGAANKL